MSTADFPFPARMPRRGTTRRQRATIGALAGFAVVVLAGWNVYDASIGEPDYVQIIRGPGISIGVTTTTGDDGT